MDPVLISLCPRSFSGYKSINLRQAGKSQMEDNISGATFDTGTEAGECTPELPHPPRDNFQLGYTVAQRVPSRVEAYGVALFLHNPLLAFFPCLPSHTTPFLQCASWDLLTKKSTCSKILIWGSAFEGTSTKSYTGLRNARVWTHMSASNNRWPSLEKEVRKERSNLFQIKSSV